MTDHPFVGADMILAERLRQVDAEGWTTEHDDEHADGELLRAAQSYVFTAMHGNSRTLPDPLWPWDASWWKPSDDPVRNLVKAGALIAAEIDRRLRATSCP